MAAPTSPAQPSRAPRSGADPRAAARRLRERYRAAERRPAKRLGQHFLADLNLAGKIVDLLPPPDAGAVLEIGPGLGALTFLLVERGYRGIAIELDRELAADLSEALAPWPGMRVRSGDVRNLDWAGLARELAQRGTGTAGHVPRYLVIGNLPYYAATEILVGLVGARRLLGATVLTVQREVAERLAARPGTRTYGSLTVMLALHASIEICRRLPPTAFWPAPDVESAVVRLDWSAPAGDDDALDRLTERVVRAAFAQRRKRLENSLAAALDLDRDRIATRLAAVGVAPAARAEELAPAEFVQLARALGDLVEAAPAAPGRRGRPGGGRRERRQP